MSHEEGVIKFKLDYTSASALPAEQVSQINAWRTIIRRLDFIGQDPARYDGYGFGNISRRLEPFDTPPEQRQFMITGTQTGHLLDLSADYYAIVTECYPEENRLVAQGPVKPSAESITHGAIYGIDEALRWVVHGHSQPIWRYAEALGLPITQPDIPYGSPELAADVRRLFRETKVSELGIFSMGGHEDGIVAFGRTAEEVGTVLLKYLAQAIALDA